MKLNIVVTLSQEKDKRLFQKKKKKDKRHVLNQFLKKLLEYLKQENILLNIFHHFAQLALKFCTSSICSRFTYVMKCQQ